jgi:glycerate-2-kinase
MRFYTITGTLGLRTIRRGATSAREALAIVEDLRETGWVVSLISRGTNAITEHELREDAGLILGP